MSPRILKAGELVFWFHSYDVQMEDRASIHVGRGKQNDVADAKIWLQPQIEIARTGRTLNRLELNEALRIIVRERARLLEAWNAHRNRSR